MSDVQTVNISVNYDIRGIDRSVVKTRSMLLAVNSLRLGIQDLQQLAESPSLGQLLWTGIQLTRVYTNLNRVLKTTNQSQRRASAGLGVRALTGGRGAGAAFGIGGRLGQAALPQFLTPQETRIPTFMEGVTGGVNLSPLFSTLAAFVAANPAATGIIVGTVAATGAFLYLESRGEKRREDWRERQRQVARSQGLEF